jgi:glycosyltransferase involved in cell wall biosynthesis
LKRKLAALLDRGFDVINYHNLSLAGGPGALLLGTATKVYTLHEHWWVCPTHVLWKYTGELCTKPECFRCCLSHRIPPQFWRRRRSFLRRTVGSLDAILAPSRFTAERHRAWLADLGLSVPLEIVPAYAEALATGTRHPLDLPDRYFLHVGRLIPEKGARFLVDAFAKRPHLALVIVGSGPLEDEIRGLGLPNVHVEGRVDRAALGAYYRNALALIVPSLCAETFGLTAAESLSAGTPVIASRCGGTEDVVSSDVGFTYSTEAELLSHVDRLAQDSSLRATLSSAALARYRSLYTEAAYLERYLAVVERYRGQVGRRS